MDLPDAKDAALYPGSLWSRIRATKVIAEIPNTIGKVPFLSFGDPEAHLDPKEGELADCFYFCRNVGRGKKQGEARGRWGLEKTMFPASSKIHGFFGITLRDGDEHTLS